jgi:type II secretory pathway component PulL
MGFRTNRLHRRLIMTVAALFGIALMSVPAAAQGTPEQRAACQGDAQRLCGQYIPDVKRITACMSSKRRYLSPGCRAAFSGGAKKPRRAGN